MRNGIVKFNNYLDISQTELSFLEIHKKFLYESKDTILITTGRGAVELHSKSNEALKTGTIYLKLTFPN